ncbi:MAG: hypothetical protein ACJ736_03990 [Streptomyces sp.]
MARTPRTAITAGALTGTRSGTARVRAAATSTARRTTHDTYYDDGNVRTRTTRAGTDTLTYDDEGDPSELSSTGSAGDTKYLYDADGTLLLRHSPDATTLLDVTFGGAKSVVIPEGGELYSDPIPMTVAPRGVITTSIHLVNQVNYLVINAETTALGERHAIGGAPPTSVAASTSGRTVWQKSRLVGARVLQQPHRPRPPRLHIRCGLPQPWP